MRKASSLTALALLGLAGCNQAQGGFAPVLGDEVSVAEKERFARRLHLDLVGLPPSPAQTEALLRRLDDEGNSASTRGALAAELIADPAMPELYLSEVESIAYSGQSIEAGYDLVCEIARSMDVACAPCHEADACACQCPAIVAFAAEKQAFLELAADLSEGGETRTSEIEKALCRSSPFLFNNTSAEGISTQLFEAFLSRPPEADELANASFMTIGSFIPGSPSGLLFHRHGESYDDLLDIVFGSEVYRDAMVTRTFERYLGRQPTGDELRFFSASLDPERPDLRPVIHAVVSSSEYFHQ